MKQLETDVVVVAAGLSGLAAAVAAAEAGARVIALEKAWGLPQLALRFRRPR